MTIAPSTIDEYIAGFTPDVQKILQQIRMTIHQAAPEAEETTKYRMSRNQKEETIIDIGYPTQSGEQTWKE